MILHLTNMRNEFITMLCQFFLEEILITEFLKAYNIRFARDNFVSNSRTPVLPSQVFILNVGKLLFRAQVVG